MKQPGLVQPVPQRYLDYQQSLAKAISTTFIEKLLNDEILRSLQPTIRNTTQECYPYKPTPANKRQPWMTLALERILHLQTIQWHYLRDDCNKIPPSGWEAECKQAYRDGLLGVGWTSAFSDLYAHATTHIEMYRRYETWRKQRTTNQAAVRLATKTPY